MSNWTDKDLRKAFGNREDHQYRHYNSALGKVIRSKEEFIHELNKGNYVPYDKAKEQAERNQASRKYDGVSEDTMRKIHQLKARADKDGKLKWDDGLIRQMKDAGVDYSQFKKVGRTFKVDTEGGFK